MLIQRKIKKKKIFFILCNYNKTDRSHFHKKIITEKTVNNITVNTLVYYLNYQRNVVNNKIFQSKNKKDFLWFRLTPKEEKISNTFFCIIIRFQYVCMI